MRFNRLPIVLISALIFLIFAATQASAGKDTLVWALDSKIPTMDIYATTSLNLTNIFHMASDSLVERDLDDLSIKPNLAVSWKRLDDRTWEFRLREGVKFHNGNPLNSEAVRYTIEDRILNPDLKARLRGAYTFIERVEILDDLNFRVHTKGPYPLILERFCTFFPYDPEWCRENGEEHVVENIMGTGPYRFVRWDKGNRLVLEKNHDYWLPGIPRIPNVLIREIPEQSTRIAELLSGGVDIISKLDPDKMALVEKNKKTQVLETPSHRISFWQFDSMGRAGDTPVKDKRVRQAIWHAIDRQAIIDTMFQGHAEIVNSPLSPFDFGYVSDLPALEYNPEKAKALLEEAGYGDGLELEIMYYYPTQHQFNSAAMGYLEKVGVKLKFNDFRGNIGQAIKVRDGGKAKDIGNFGWASYMLLDADGTLPIWFGEGSNKSYTDDPELSGWIEEARFSFDHEKRAELYRKAQERIIEEVYWMPINTVNTIYGANAKLRLKLPINETLLLKIAEWSE
jgi:peptide/nickel transport system substrate-binding protein